MIVYLMEVAIRGFLLFLDPQLVGVWTLLHVGTICNFYDNKKSPIHPKLHETLPNAGPNTWSLSDS